MRRSSKKTSTRKSSTSGRTSSRGEGSSRGSSRGESRGKSSSRRGNKDKEYAFSRIGSLTVAKSTAEEYGDEVVEELQDSGYQIWAQIYLPEGTESVKLRHEEKVLISFKEVEGAPDFVVGTISVEN